MHNVLTLWYKFVIRSNTVGNSFLAVYADDFIAGFQYKEEAERYYALLKERLKKFNLELEESKSRMIEFGKYAEINSKRKYGRKAETFNFLGFTLYCGKSRHSGAFCVKLKTNSKKFTQKLKQTKGLLKLSNYEVDFKEQNASRSMVKAAAFPFAIAFCAVMISSEL